jgi:branched-chain amino acid transport system permease protein
LGNARKKYIPLLVVILSIIAPIAFRNDIYFILLLCMIGMYIISVSGLDILFGYSGQISLGHAGFYGIGAYASAILSTKLEMPAFISMVSAVIVAIIFAILLAMPAAKLVHHFLALLTIAFGQLFYLVVANSDELTGGFSGINFIPPFEIGPFALDTNFKYYYLILASVIVCLLIKQRIIKSRIGRAFVAIRENSHAANGSGINVTSYKMMAFAISAAFTAFSGALYAHFIRFVSPESFVLNQSIIFLTMLLFGGMGNFYGPIIGAVIITIINEYFQALGNYQMLIYGVFIILILMFMPKGLVGGFELIAKRFGRKEGGVQIVNPK